MIKLRSVTKSRLRKIYLARQKSLTGEKRLADSRRVIKRFFSKFDLENVKYLHLFLSIEKKGELDTSFLINKLREADKTKLLIPRVNFEADRLEHLEFGVKTRLKENTWGIIEPTGDQLIPEGKVDLVVVPLLCFDQRGFRVGYGKGFYDKFLSLCREDCKKIGLSLFGPVKEIEDIHSHDVKLDYCITPEKVWSFN
ncbi:MAG: 5-formyltetrahydrofolate cyclo-ligase [Pyrinomonadaceae bacterium]|nr:5-formyltetrahydrofolate cyclo-ligase [Pyrinomonadaceae bacterium]